MSSSFENQRFGKLGRVSHLHCPTLLITMHDDWWLKRRQLAVSSSLLLTTAIILSGKEPWAE